MSEPPGKVFSISNPGFNPFRKPATNTRYLYGLVISKSQGQILAEPCPSVAAHSWLFLREGVVRDFTLVSG
jgi:hypothetical protein